MIEGQPREPCAARWLAEVLPGHCIAQPVNRRVRTDIGDDDDPSTDGSRASTPAIGASESIVLPA